MYEDIKRITDFDYNGKKVIMRVDFNVPLDKKTREITSTARIDAAMPSIKHILDHGAEKLILMSHLGKPKKVAAKGGEYISSLSLDVVAKKLGEIMQQEVAFVKDYMNSAIPDEKLILLENTRFNLEHEESKDDPSREMLAQRLASFADIFINDAFGSSHRKHASVYDIAKYIPCGIGFLVDKEINQLSRLIVDPQAPYVAILGGAKVEDKIKVIEALSHKVDEVIIVGAMEYAFQKAQGKNVGLSLCEGVDTAKQALAASYFDKLTLPIDTVVAKKEGDNYTDIRTVPAGEIPEGYSGLDIGEKSIALIQERCKNANTIFWNGPAGMFEVEPFDKGTNAIAQYLATLSSVRIVGGGDSVTAIEKTGLQDKYTHISTGGGASLDLIQDSSLVALDIQEQKQNAK